MAPPVSSRLRRLARGAARLAVAAGVVLAALPGRAHSGPRRGEVAASAPLARVHPRPPRVVARALPPAPAGQAEPGAPPGPAPAHPATPIAALRLPAEAPAARPADAPLRRRLNRPAHRANPPPGPAPS